MGRGCGALAWAASHEFFLVFTLSAVQADPSRPRTRRQRSARSGCGLLQASRSCRPIDPAGRSRGGLSAPPRRTDLSDRRSAPPRLRLADVGRPRVTPRRRRTPARRSAGDRAGLLDEGSGIPRIDLESPTRMRRENLGLSSPSRTPVEDPRLLGSVEGLLLAGEGLAEGVFLR